MYTRRERAAIAKLTNVQLEAILDGDPTPEVEEAVYSELDARELAEIEEWYADPS